MLQKFLLIFVMCCALFNAECSAISVADRIVQSTALGVQKIRDVIDKLSNLPLTYEQLLSMSVTFLYELPTRFGISALSIFCILAIDTDSNLNRKEYHKPDYNELRITFYNDIEETTYHLSELKNVVTHYAFDKTAPVIILMTGWLTNLQEEKQKAAEVIYTAYKCRGYNNFLLFDPHVAIETLYSWSALNTHDLAEYITPAIIELTKNVDIKQLHLIGHSLGAHIAGNIGRIYKEETGKTLPRITGLDPARVCFNTGGGLRGLERGVADLVDVIHSNSGGLGAKDSIGDVDFFPNGAVVNMPGCSSLSCSHSRSWRYYAESVYPGNENGFLAKRCNLFLAYKQELCSGEDIIPMGYATPTNATGNYYLETNAESPYGFNSMTSVKCAN